jgi:hypothetical protein
MDVPRILHGYSEDIPSLYRHGIYWEYPRHIHGIYSEYLWLKVGGRWVLEGVGNYGVKGGFCHCPYLCCPGFAGSKAHRFDCLLRVHGWFFVVGALLQIEGVSAGLLYKAKWGLVGEGKTKTH